MPHCTQSVVYSFTQTGCKRRTVTFQSIAFYYFWEALLSVSPCTVAASTDFHHLGAGPSSELLLWSWVQGATQPIVSQFQLVFSANGLFYHDHSLFPCHLPLIQEDIHFFEFVIYLFYLQNSVAVGFIILLIITTAVLSRITWFWTDRLESLDSFALW